MVVYNLNLLRPHFMQHAGFRYVQPAGPATHIASPVTPEKSQITHVSFAAAAAAGLTASPHYTRSHSQLLEM